MGNYVRGLLRFTAGFFVGWTVAMLATLTVLREARRGESDPATLHDGLRFAHLDDREARSAKRAAEAGVTESGAPQS